MDYGPKDQVFQHGLREKKRKKTWRDSYIHICIYIRIYNEVWVSFSQRTLASSPRRKEKKENKKPKKTWLKYTHMHAYTWWGVSIVLAEDFGKKIHVAHANDRKRWRKEKKKRLTYIHVILEWKSTVHKLSLVWKCFSLLLYPWKIHESGICMYIMGCHAHYVGR